MRPMLAYVACLDRKSVAEHLLPGEVPLLGNCRLHMRIPDANQRGGKGISGGAASYDSLFRSRARKRESSFRRGTWRVDGKTYVFSGAFQIGRHTERRSDNKRPIESGWRP